MQLVICLEALENVGNYCVPYTFLMKCLLENQSCLSHSKAETISVTKWDLDFSSSLVAVSFMDCLAF